MESVHSPAAARRFSPRKMKRLCWTTLRFAGLCLISFIMLVPFLWMLSSSFKFDREIFSYPIQWIPETFRFSNYVEVWSRLPFLTYYFNTFKIAALSTLGRLTLSSMAAYSFAKLNYPGRDKLFLCYLATMMIPWHATMIPQFLVNRTLGLYGTHAVLILMAMFNAFGVFLLRQFMMGIPDELCQAARIDGCSELRIYANIILPLSKPGLATLTVMTFTSVWNDYLAPMIYLDKQDMRTIQIGLTAFKSTYNTEYGLLMAGTVCSLLPIVIIYIFAQRYLVEGMSFTGVKG